MNTESIIREARNTRLLRGGLSISFIIQKGKAKADGRAPILARVTVNGKMTHMSTKQYVRPDRWLPDEHRTMGLTRQEKEINEYLETFQVAIQKRYLDKVLRDESISAYSIKSSVLNAPTKGKPTDIMPLFDCFIEDYKALMKQEGYRREAMLRYQILQDQLRLFLKEEYHVADLPLTCIDRQFLDKLYLWFRTKHNKVNNNTAVKNIQRFSTVFKKARDNGWVSGNPFGLQKRHLEKVDRGYLTQEEIDIMYHKELATERLEHIRDFFIFSCYTGLCYADVKSLTFDEIEEKPDGSLWICTHRTKTDTPVNVRLLEIPLAIINKYRGQGTGNHVFPIPSNQKTNAYLKEISDICGFKKTVTFHMARHTFATTVTLSNGVPIESVSKMLGHTNIQTTQIYARITDQKVDGDMKMLAGKIDGRYSNPIEPSTQVKERSKYDEELVIWAREHGLNLGKEYQLK